MAAAIAAVVPAAAMPMGPAFADPVVEQADPLPPPVGVPAPPAPALPPNPAAVAASLDQAVLVVEATEGDLRRARERERRIADRVADLRAELEQLAVDAYVGVGEHDPGAVLLTANDVDDGLQRRAMVDMLGRDRAAVVEELQATKAKRRRSRQRVEAAVAEAELHRDTLARDLDIARAAPQPVGLPSVLPAAATAGSSQGPPTGTMATVRAITVDSSLVGDLSALLAAADADGLRLGGSGYRDATAQRRLRAQNCPSAASPPSACSPPTARPGRSLHERGLAIDMTSGGQLIGSRRDPAFAWLAANAERFGLRNLPSEPWHWSTSGK